MKVVEAQKVARELRAKLGEIVPLGTKQVILFVDTDDVERYEKGLEAIDAYLEFEIKNPIHMPGDGYTSVPEDLEAEDAVFV